MKNVTETRRHAIKSRERIKLFDAVTCSLSFHDFSAVVQESPGSCTAGAGV